MGDDEIRLGGRNILLVVISFLAIVVIGVAALIVIAAIFTFGSPLLLISALVGLGVFGIVALVALLLLLVSIWYVIYALLNEYLFNNSKKEKERNGENSGSYTLDRIKKTP